MNRIERISLVNQTWDLFSHFKGNAPAMECLSLFIGFLVIVDYDSKNSRGAFVKEIGNKHVDVTMQEIVEYGERLEKEVYPAGFFRSFAFVHIEEFDPIFLCEYFIHIVELYDSVDRENKGAEILMGVLDRYYSNMGKTGGESSDPYILRKLVCDLADVKAGGSVYDPCAGVAGYAWCLASEFMRNDVKYVGTEPILSTCYMAQALLLLNGMKESKVECKNSLLEPQTEDGIHLSKFDRVITNPPFSLRMDEKTYRIVTEDSFGRFRYGIPGKIADWLFVEIAISALNDCGKAVVVVSNGPLFRSNEARVRERIVKDDILEAVIQLPGGILSHTAIPVCILIFNKKKDSKLQGKILSIDASSLGTKAVRGLTEFSEDDIEKIVKAYRSGIEEEGFTRIFTAEEIATDEYNLHLSAISKSQEALSKLAEGYIKLNDVTSEVTRGVQVTPEVMKKVADKENGSHYLLSISNIENGKLVVSEENLINPQQKWVKNYEVQPGDILVAARGTFKCAIVGECFPSSIASGNLIIIRLKGSYSPYVLKYYFESELGQQLISQVQSGVAAQIINADALSKMLVPDLSAVDMEIFEEKIRIYTEKYEELLAKAAAYKERAEKELNDAMHLYRV